MGAPGSIIGSLAGGIGDTLLGSIFGGSGSKTKQLEKQLQLQNKYNKEMLDYQNQINTENWNMQNEYNSPLAQRQRLSEAGLNENLMYDGYSMATADSIAAGSANGSGSLTDYGSGSDSTMLGLALKNTQADIALKETQSKKNLSEANRIDQTTPLDLQYKGYMNSMAKIEQDYLEGTYDARVATTKSMARQNELTEDVLVSQIGLNGAQARGICANIVKTSHEISAIEQGLKESKSRIRLNDANIANLQKLSEVYVSQRLLNEIKFNRESFSYDLDVATLQDKITSIASQAQEDFARAIVELGKTQNPNNWFGADGVFGDAITFFSFLRAASDGDAYDPGDSFNSTNQPGNALNWLTKTHKKMLNKYSTPK